MTALLRDVRVSSSGQGITVRLEMENRSGAEWKHDTFFVGYQLFDPASGRFIREGEWLPLARDTGPGESVPVDLTIGLPAGPAGYRIYVSPLDQRRGWLYARGERFLVIDAEVGSDRADVIKTEVTTQRALRWRSAIAGVPRLFISPFETALRNRALIRSMVRRDITARYRGSFGDLFWTVLNPLLLSLTYYFVFGVVLRTRFGADQSSGGFLLYFLAGMLPWLAFSEAVGRAPNSMLDNRTFVKKLVFPLDTISINHAVAGLITEVFGIAVFLCFVIALRGGVPLTAAWLPVVLAPQLLFTLGVCWFLAALGVFIRDLAQMIGFILTLWFFITPICYPEQSIPPAIASLLDKNPLYVMVRAYRAMLLEGHGPNVWAMIVLWMVSAAVFFLGHAWFSKLRKTFADVV